jgi:hypothetical protein
MNAIKLVLVAASALVCGCSTFVSGEKAGQGKAGIQYSLPIPVVRVTPQPDGTMDVQVEMLPDPDNTYVLRTSTLLSSYTLDVVRENGMLKTVTMDAKADAVAQALAEAKAELIKTKAAAEEKARETATKAAKDKATAIEAAKTDLLVAETKLQTLEAAPKGVVSAAALLEAQVVVATAQAKLDALLGSSAGAGTASFNVPAGQSAAKVAAAPVLFRVVPNLKTGGVTLVAFEGMEPFLPTSTAAIKPDEKKAVPELRVAIQGNGVLTRGKPFELLLDVNRPVTSVDLKGSTLTAVGGANFNDRIQIINPNLKADHSGTVLIVTLDPTTPAGSYFLEPRMLSKDGPMRADPVRFRIN